MSYQDRMFEVPRECTKCKRPYPTEPSPEDRARANRRKELEAAKLVADPTGACRAVLDVLENAARLALLDGNAQDGGWVESQVLRDAINGDGPRRARDLRDVYGYHVETKVVHQPRKTGLYRVAGWPNHRN